ncbi:hypothetical protein GCM10023321_77200 [Pseudonocardia eucalypti]|uniref:Antitoxin n=1 Tax=Pseudonocardia eucalypti TaxID=648755 RepID=A0ABP9RBM4_9PSEU|nr:antitoxin (DNA-binding transcriptional repressor) of toxin-antitoxin stability system [Pseudonocardia eucalypti]
MTAAHAYELPPDSAAPAEAVKAAASGEVVYLTRDGRATAAIVPPDVAAAGAAAIQALEDAADIRAAEAALADSGPTIPHEEVMAMYADDLAAYPETEEDR